jgi:hypothetical protein
LTFDRLRIEAVYINQPPDSRTEHNVYFWTLRGCHDGGDEQCVPCGVCSETYEARFVEGLCGRTPFTFSFGPYAADVGLTVILYWYTVNVAISVILNGAVQPDILFERLEPSRFLDALRISWPSGEITRIDDRSTL